MNIDFWEFTKHVFEEISSFKALVANFSTPAAKNNAKDNSARASMDCESFLSIVCKIE